VLDHVHIAASRERPGRRDYVQDRIREQGALIWRLLAAGSHVYNLRLAADARRRPRRLRRCRRGPRVAATRARGGLPAGDGDHRPLPPRPLGPNSGDHIDVLALLLTLAALVMFAFAASDRELSRFNEIALGLVLLTAALICQFTSITNTHFGR